MLTRTPACVALLALAAALLAVSCGGEDVFLVERKAGPNKPPEIRSVDPPEASPIAIVGQPVVFSVDARDPEGDDLAFEFTIDGSLVTSNSDYVYTPAETGTRRVRVVVSDGKLSASFEWLLAVTNLAGNRPPVFEEVSPPGETIETTVGETVAFWVRGSDPDGDELSYRFVVNDSVIVPGHMFDYVASQPGTDRIRAEVSDGKFFAEHEWLLTVTPSIGNQPPRILDAVPLDAAPRVVVGESITFYIDADDPDGDELSFEFTLDDSVVADTSGFDYSTTELGTYTIRAEVSDGDLSAVHLWILTVTTPPDVIPPAEVPIVAAGAGALARQIWVSWIAVGDDGMVGRATEYVVGAADGPIENASDWVQADKYFVAGGGVDAGAQMTHTVSRPGAGQYTAITVRAVDDWGNYSPLGAYAEGYTRGYSYGGEVRDLITDGPLAGVVVRGSDRSTTTDANGQWSLENMPHLSVGLRITDDDIPGPIGDYYDYIISEPNHDGAYFRTQLFPDYELESSYYQDNFVNFFLLMTTFAGPPYPTYMRNWELPIDIYVEPFMKYVDGDSLDYKATVERVAEELASVVGLECFRVVDSPPDTGTVCEFRDGYTSHAGVREWTVDGYPLHGVAVFDTKYTPTSLFAFERVIRHELGHILGLWHSQDAIHLMVGGQAPQVDTFNADEILILNIIFTNPLDVPLDGVAYVRD